MYKHFKKYKKRDSLYQYKKNISEEQQQKIKLLYEEKLDIMKKLFALSSTYNLIDIMFQQEIKNNILFKKYFYLFYLQKITSIIGYNVLPSEYKYPHD